MDPSAQRRIVEVFRSHSDVAAVYLFGSRANGTAGPDSDIDVAVLFGAAPSRTLDGPRFAIEGELERELAAPVDLVVLNEVPVDLRVRVLRTGHLLVDRNPALRIAFEVRTRNEAFDLQPVLDRYRSARGR